MKKNIAFIVIAFFMAINLNVLNAQNNAAAPATPKLLKPKVLVADLIFSYQLLNTIELKGSEVDALLEIKNVLKPYIEKIQKDNLSLTTAVQFDIQAPIAANLLQFMERGKFTGGDAEKYKRFVDGIVESAKLEENK